MLGGRPGDTPADDASFNVGDDVDPEPASNSMSISEAGRTFLSAP